jgi:Tfp pilus assembly protein PilX
MVKQQGSSLVFALVLLTIITLIAVYAIESSVIQGKMVASSLFSSLTYQECRNEQEANVRFYNDSGGVNRSALLNLKINPADNNTINVSGIQTFTKAYTATGVKTAKSDISYKWSYMGLAPAAFAGGNLDLDAPVKAYLYENDCTAKFGFSTNKQTLGVIVKGLSMAGNIK